MAKKRFSHEQIAFALRQAAAGTNVGEICRKMRVAEAMLYRWKKVYAGMGGDHCCVIDGVDGPRLRHLDVPEWEPRRIHRKEPSLAQPPAIGLDLAKNVFQGHGVDADGQLSSAVRCGVRRCWQSLSRWSRVWWGGKPARAPSLGTGARHAGS